MIKVFERDDKVNFVDDQNRLVGYDTFQSCCENAGYLVLSEVVGLDKLTLIESGVEASDLVRYTFDPAFFLEQSDDEDGGGGVVFKLVSDAGEPDLYLHLYNIHNGYYSHGFYSFAGNGSI